MSSVCASVLPQQTYADPAALSESTETKPLFAVNVRQRKGEILPHLIVWNPGNQENTHKHTHTHIYKRPKPKESMDNRAPNLQMITN